MSCKNVIVRIIMNIELGPIIRHIQHNVLQQTGNERQEPSKLAVTYLTCTEEVSSSNLGYVTDYPKVHRGFPLSLRTKSGTASLTRSLRFLSLPFQIIIQFILPLDTVRTDILTRTINHKRIYKYFIKCTVNSINTSIVTQTMKSETRVLVPYIKI